MIHRADKVLGTDHSVFVNRAIRGFQNRALDSRGLVPYFADAPLGEPIGTSRGCGNSYVSLFAPEIWPEQARKWYDLYSRYFWQETWTCAGFREYPKDLPANNWDLDVDSGLVLKGFGCAACAFGVGAARVNGHFEHAYPLTPRCWSPRGRFRMAHVSFPGCFPTRPMLPTSVRPPFYLTSPVCRRKEFPSRPAVPCQDSS